MSKQDIDIQIQAPEELSGLGMSSGNPWHMDSDRLMGHVHSEERSSRGS